MQTKTYGESSDSFLVPFHSLTHSQSPLKAAVKSAPHTTRKIHATIYLYVSAKWPTLHSSLTWFKRNIFFCTNHAYEIAFGFGWEWNGKWEREFSWKPADISYTWARKPSYNFVFIVAFLISFYVSVVLRMSITHARRDYFTYESIGRCRDADYAVSDQIFCLAFSLRKQKW